MAYQLKSVTIRTDNSQEGLRRTQALWQDIFSGRLPILCDSTGAAGEPVTPMAMYSGYSSDETGDFDLTVLSATPQLLAELEDAVAGGTYRRYEAAGSDLTQCAGQAWGQVWQERQAGLLSRAYTRDYERAVPAQHAADGRARCILYIALA